MKDAVDRPPDGADLCHALRELTAVERRSGLAPGGGTATPSGVARERAGDPQFRVETESVNGMHTVVAITACGGSDGPSAAAPAEAESAALRSLVRSLLDLAGHESGTARTTVALTPRGPRVVSCRLPSCEPPSGAAS